MVVWDVCEVVDELVVFLTLNAHDNLIQQILHNNGYNTPTRKTMSNNKKHESNIEKSLWTKYTSSGRETRTITKVLKNNKVKITYSMKNTLRKLLMRKRQLLRNKYEN